MCVWVFSQLTLSQITSKSSSNSKSLGMEASEPSATSTVNKGAGDPTPRLHSLHGHSVLISGLFLAISIFFFFYELGTLKRESPVWGEK